MARKTTKLMALLLVLTILVAQLAIPASAAGVRTRLDTNVEMVEGIARIDTSPSATIRSFVNYIVNLFFGWLGIDFSPIVYPVTNPEFVAADNEATNVLSNDAAVF